MSKHGFASSLLFRKFLADLIKEENHVEQSIGKIFAFGHMRQVCPLLQNGPQCGMVALSMASEILKGTPVQCIYEATKSKNYTNYGEMFSAFWMQELAQEVLQCQVELVKYDESSRKATVLRMLSFLLQPDSCILVPYDSDKNHAPCLKNGLSAHWALLTGFVVVQNQNSTYRQRVEQYLIEDEGISNLFWIDRLESIEFNELCAYDQSVFHFVAYHGKSKHPAVWSAENLLISNSQLNEFNSKLDNDGLRYILPVNGVKELKDACLLLQN